VSPDPFGLEGRVALVTGAGGGLGEGICASLAAAGAAVACVDRSEESAAARAEQLRAAGADAVAVVADVSDEASVDAMARRVVDELGGIDILVNNAGIYPSRPWLEVSVEEFDAVQATNVRGYFLCARACHASLAGRGHGRVVNVSSITISGGWENLLAYVTSKGAVVTFTRALAREVGKEGITVNCIAPGAFPTDAEKIHPDPEGYVRLVLERQALKRRGTPDDVGNLVRFLASDASSFITGQLVAIDGGWVMH
jgi:NAD(P)-dependent dehydrogenase (short-subunit alcohol dehydrogenase family)